MEVGGGEHGQVPQVLSGVAAAALGMQRTHAPCQVQPIPSLSYVGSSQVGEAGDLLRVEAYFLQGPPVCGRTGSVCSVSC